MINVYDAILSDHNYFKQLKVKDALLVNYQCPQKEEWVDLYSHFNHIVYTLGGKKIMKRPGKQSTLTEGSLFFLRKGAMTQGHFFNVDWRTIAFCIPDTYLQQSFNEYRSQLPPRSLPAPPAEPFIDIATNNTTHAFFYSLLPYFTQSPPPPENLLELKCRELMFTIFSQPGNEALLAYINSICNSKRTTLTEVMEANYMYNLSLEEFARISQRSLSAFKKDFTEVFQTSPGKWLIQRRLENAQQLLTTSEKNVNEIAYESGFESTSHFSRVFKEKFNVAPLQYRRQVV